MNGATGAAASVNGAHFNGYESSDNPAAVDANVAGGTFRNSTPEDHANYQPVGGRVPNAHMPEGTFMTQSQAESDPCESSSLSRKDGSDHEDSDSGSSELSNFGSSLSSEEAGASRLAQRLEDLTVGSTENAAEPCIDKLKRLLEDLTVKLMELESLSGQADSEEGKAKYENAIEELGLMIGNSIGSNLSDDLQELNKTACGIQSWLEKNSKLIGKFEVQPGGIRVPDVKTGSLCNVQFDGYINGVANSGVMVVLNELMKKIDSYLGKHDIQLSGYCLCTRAEDGIYKPVLSLSLSWVNNRELADFTFLLDGDSQKGIPYFFDELNGFLRPVFGEMREAGASAPERSLVESYQ
ncbi:hypothetical protein [Endozoicomonas elysicola]|uniref:Uncharacterized protein n=1 Tax=Endozoicomonas elysicola TaxID=305900 RepID=A0A081KDK6_9GAMM|nr:hypothetical protein [Endozoicomonas elysicola]KEI72232.1 hypothetical protein GV64_17185 [Endozoicomonas elysicola]